VATATTTTVSWTSGFSVYIASENGSDGADGVKTAEAIVYQWATTIPTISGSSTYDWASDAVTSAPTGWFTTISDTATAGQTLWKASVALTDSVTATTSTVNWATASILPFGYVGSTGAVGRIAYAVSSTTLSTTPNIFTVTGDALPATGSWQAGLVWSYSVPVLTAGQSVWQSDGVYNPTNNQTIWEVPYLSSLKVGNLSAISTNTGSLTVSGNVTVGAFGNIRGGQTAYNTGTGFFLGYSGATYRFSIGSVKVGSANISTDVITSNTHGFVNGTSIYFTNLGEITGISVDQVYYVISATLNTFQVASSVGGAAINLGGTNSSVLFTSQSFSWDGSSLNVVGGSITSSVFKTATIGQRIAINENNSNEIDFYGDRGDGVTTRLATIGITSIGTDSVIIEGGGTEVQKVGAYFRSKNSNTFFGNAFKNTPDPDSTNVHGLVAVGTGFYTGGSFVVGSGGPNNTGSFGWSQGTSGLNQFSRGVHGLSTNGIGVFGEGSTYDFYAGGTGSNYGPFTGSHDGLVNNLDTMETGDIVVDAELLYKYNISSCIFRNVKSSVAEQAAVIGVVSNIKPVTLVSLPAALIADFIPETNETVPIDGAEQIIEDRYRIMINAIGEGQVNVCGENGNIQKGDLIVSSSIPGKGMKQSDNIVRSITVAKAREDVSFSSPTEVKMVACIYLCG
jgi:hypothetical protein